MLKSKSINAYLLMQILALFLTLTANWTFFSKVTEIYPLAENLGFLVSVFIVLFGVQLFLLVLLGYRHTIKVVFILMLLIASVTSYFTDSYGAVYDTNMLQNALQTNSSEAGELLNIKFITRIILLGILPGVLIWKLKPVFPNFLHSVGIRVAMIAISLTLVGLPVFIFSTHYTSFFREHKPLRYYTNPITPVYSAVKLVQIKYNKFTEPSEMIMHAIDAKKISTSTSRKPKLVVMVVGEAARADHVSLNGYKRETFPQLSQVIGLTNFEQTTSCGTSTAYSVPCMFGYVNEKNYDVDKASYNENVVDTLNRLGVNVQWRDNNSSSKGVMDRLPKKAYRNYQIADNNLSCDNEFEECRDVGMLSGLGDNIVPNADNFIVLHQMGNHGPAYYKRYDSKFSKFMPVCESNELSTCDRQSLINAYDNALLATDDFLAKTIDWLENYDETYDVAMLYASDHGESLGENGVYLHGMPKAFAPKAQYTIPAMLWLGKKSSALPVSAQAQLSHDAIAPTILNLFDITTTVGKSKTMFVKVENKPYLESFASIKVDSAAIKPSH